MRFSTHSARAVSSVGWVNIKRGKRKIHISFMLSAVVFSGLFLVSYVVYHHFHGDTPFPGRGLVRPVYFFILFSHVVLSVVDAAHGLQHSALCGDAAVPNPPEDRALHTSRLALRLGNGRHGSSFS